MLNEIELFIKDSENNFNINRRWFNFENWKVYLRIWKKHINWKIKDYLQIATVEAFELRKGFFKEVVKTCEELWKKYKLNIFIENCMYDFLFTFLEKRNYECIENNWNIKSFLKK